MKLDQLLQLNLSNKKTYIAEAKKKSKTEPGTESAEPPKKPKAEKKSKAAKPKAAAKKPKADKPKTSRAAEKTEPYTKKRKPAANTPAAKLKAQVDSKPDYSEPDLPTLDDASMSEHKPLPDDPQQAIVVVQKQLEMKQGPEWDRLKRALSWASQPSLSSKLGSAARGVAGRIGSAARGVAGQHRGFTKSIGDTAREAGRGLSTAKDVAKRSLQKAGLYGKTGLGDDFVADLADLITEDPDVLSEALDDWSPPQPPSRYQEWKKEKEKEAARTSPKAWYARADQDKEAIEDEEYVNDREWRDMGPPDKDETETEKTESLEEYLYNRGHMVSHVEPPEEGARVYFNQISHNSEGYIAFKDNKTWVTIQSDDDDYVPNNPIWKLKDAPKPTKRDRKRAKDTRHKRLRDI